MSKFINITFIAHKNCDSVSKFLQLIIKRSMFPKLAEIFPKSQIAYIDSKLILVSFLRRNKSAILRYVLNKTNVSPLHKNSRKN